MQINAIHSIYIDAVEDQSIFAKMEKFMIDSGNISLDALDETKLQ